VKFEPRDRQLDSGHALCGPIAVIGAEPGMTIEVRVESITPGTWGWSSGGGFSSPTNDRLGVSDAAECVFRWALDGTAGTATNQHGQTVAMRPFLGVIGMPPGEPGDHSTAPPRYCGGNVDCKELVAGSSLFLPVSVPGGLLSLGDGHAVQGDGEVSGLAIECPMESVDITVHLHPDLRLSMPRAETPVGRITFGLHEDLNEATILALEGMLSWLGELFGYDRTEALAMASLVVDCRITQIVNGVRGVHAVLPHGALTE
jgi:acetamidase/formamidase